MFTVENWTPPHGEDSAPEHVNINANIKGAGDAREEKGHLFVLHVHLRYTVVGTASSLPYNV